MTDPKEIFLAPYCEGADDRRWCEDDMAGDWCHCDECEGKPSVRYVRADLYAELEAQLAEAHDLLVSPPPLWNEAFWYQRRDALLNALAGQGGSDGNE